MGDKFRTVERLEIIETDLENNLLFVKGSVPGAKNAVVEINKAEFDDFADDYDNLLKKSRFKYC